jgi:hypothetical protein
MATVKISELPNITTINANTANTVLVGVDLVTTTTGKMTLTTLANGLYSNNNLAVGNTFLLLPNAIAQFTGNTTEYLQVNLHNLATEGSGDYVITADDGSDINHYIDLGMNGSQYSDPDYYALRSHDGYLYVKYTGANKGNLVVGTTNSTGKVSFIVGGTQTSNIVGYIDSTGLKFNNIDAQITANAASANSVINTRISANVAALRVEITANAVTGQAFTQAAYNTANTALANTSGIATAGDFYISGDGFVNGTFVLANSTFGATESALTIKATTTVQPLSQSGTMIHVTGKANTPARIIYDSFSTDGSAYSLVAGRSARGTAVSPTATQNNDVLMRMAGNGWGTTGFAPLGVARIDIVATENYTDSARGSMIKFYNIRTGTNTVQEIASFNGDAVHFDGYINPEKGFIYTPRVFAGSQTAITIDFANNVLVRANVSADYAVSFSNFVPGKQVELWMTNTSGSNRTFTHGCSAINSTTNSTTFTHPATSTIVAKYMCFGTDTANVLVQVVGL